MNPNYTYYVNVDYIMLLTQLTTTPLGTLYFTLAKGSAWSMDPNYL